MISGIGIDSVEIERFHNWHLYTRSQLSRIFSPEEIDYCLEIPIKSAERFAIRFAAREAFFKALRAAVPNHTVPFLTVCRNSSIRRLEKGNPVLYFQWNLTGLQVEKELHCHLSLTHSKTMATAIVLLEDKT